MAKGGSHTIIQVLVKDNKVLVHVNKRGSHTIIQVLVTGLLADGYWVLGQIFRHESAVALRQRYESHAQAGHASFRKILFFKVSVVF